MTKNEMLYKIGLASGALHSILADLSYLDGGILKKALKARRLVMECKNLIDKKVTDEALARVAKGWQDLAKREEAKYYEEKRAKTKGWLATIAAEADARKGAVEE